MRRYIYLFAMLSLFVIGCQENSILQPYDENSNNVSGTLLKPGEPNWIELPYTKVNVSTNGISSISSVSKTIKRKRWWSPFYKERISWRTIW